MVSRRADVPASALGVGDPDRRHLIRNGPRPVTPDDAVPRLIGLGLPVAAAQQLVEEYAEQRVIDALDALDELDADRRVLDPVGWVDAAVKQRWDLTSVLAQRREREQRVAALDGDRQQRDAARAAYPAWRATADRWDTAISAALDDDQLSRAVDELTDDVPSVGRRSVPIVRAELITWAVEVHGRDPSQPLAAALTGALDRGPRPGPGREWPLPEPPAPAAGGDVSSLTDRIARVIGTDLGTGRLPSPALEVAVPQRAISADEGLWR